MLCTTILAGNKGREAKCAKTLLSSFPGVNLIDVGTDLDSDVTVLPLYGRKGARRMGKHGHRIRGKGCYPKKLTLSLRSTTVANDTCAVMRQITQ
ncbi:MAG: hypothetical protein Ct9H300mP11_28190 [Chloroflexota bacterium]|nr:MAG: hypothetical protein Ct9H300mP11_28190 [Chloroflexota bacterium]